MDFEEVLKAARENDTVLEINASPKRLDLNAVNIKKAIEAGVKLIINSDAHQKSQFHYMKFGVYQARRGWAEAKDIVNTQPLDKLTGYFKK